MDGNGLSKIENPSLARAILDKVNNMNLTNLAQCGACAGAFALLPQSASAPLVSLALVFAVLYAARGSIPEPKA